MKSIKKSLAVVLAFAMVVTMCSVLFTASVFAVNDVTYIIEEFEQDFLAGSTDPIVRNGVTWLATSADNVTIEGGELLLTSTEGGTGDYTSLIIGGLDWDNYVVEADLYVSQISGVTLPGSSPTSSNSSGVAGIEVMNQSETSGANGVMAATLNTFFTYVPAPEGELNPEGKLKISDGKKFDRVTLQRHTARNRTGLGAVSITGPNPSSNDVNGPEGDAWVNARVEVIGGNINVFVTDYYTDKVYNYGYTGLEGNTGNIALSTYPGISLSVDNLKIAKINSYDGEESNAAYISGKPMVNVTNGERGEFAYVTAYSKTGSIEIFDKVVTPAEVVTNATDLWDYVSFEDDGYDTTKPGVRPATLNYGGTSTAIDVIYTTDPSMTVIEDFSKNFVVGNSAEINGIKWTFANASISDGALILDGMTASTATIGQKTWDNYVVEADLKATPKVGATLVNANTYGGLGVLEQKESGDNGMIPSAIYPVLDKVENNVIQGWSKASFQKTAGRNKTGSDKTASYVGTSGVNISNDPVTDITLHEKIAVTGGYMEVNMDSIAYNNGTPALTRTTDSFSVTGLQGLTGYVYFYVNAGMSLAVDNLEIHPAADLADQSVFTIYDIGAPLQKIGSGWAPYTFGVTYYGFKASDVVTATAAMITDNGNGTATVEYAGRSMVVPYTLQDVTYTGISAEDQYVLPGTDVSALKITVSYDGGSIVLNGASDGVTVSGYNSAASVGTVQSVTASYSGFDTVFNVTTGYGPVNQFEDFEGYADGDNPNGPSAGGTVSWNQPSWATVETVDDNNYVNLEKNGGIWLCSTYYTNNIYLSSDFMITSEQFATLTDYTEANSVNAWSQFALCKLGKAGAGRFLAFVMYFNNEGQVIYAIRLNYGGSTDASKNGNYWLAEKSGPALQLDTKYNLTMLIYGSTVKGLVNGNTVVSYTFDTTDTTVYDEEFNFSESLAPAQFLDASSRFGYIGAMVRRPSSREDSDDRILGSVPFYADNFTLGSVSEDVLYSVASATAGINVPASVAMSGDEIWVKVSEPDGKMLNAGSITYTANGVTKNVVNKAGTYYGVRPYGVGALDGSFYAFKMPAANTTVSATFSDVASTNFSVATIATSTHRDASNQLDGIRFLSRLYLPDDPAGVAILTDKVLYNGAEYTVTDFGSLIIPTFVLENNSQSLAELGINTTSVMKASAYASGSCYGISDDYVDFTVLMMVGDPSKLTREYQVMAYVELDDGTGAKTYVYGNVLAKSIL